MKYNRIHIKFCDILSLILAARFVNDECEGKSSCSFTVGAQFFGGHDPCFMTYKYATVNYSC